MDSVNKTLYIPLYGKSYVSKRGLFLDDKMAEQIWEAEEFPLKGKSRSKWLAYYMGIRSAVFDNWVKQKITHTPDSIVLHLGCGLDSRVLRVGARGHKWYDVDFPEVIHERKRHYSESSHYQMIAGDIRNRDWLEKIPEVESAIVVMEGVSMYLSPDELKFLMEYLSSHFQHVAIFMDCYTSFAAKMSKYKNPVNDVGVSQVYGIGDPKILQQGNLKFANEHLMIPQDYLSQLKGLERYIFQKLYAGTISKKLYRLFEYTQK